MRHGYVYPTAGIYWLRYLILSRVKAALGQHIETLSIRSFRLFIGHKAHKVRNIVADLIKGLFKHFVPQMGSANTFARKVVEQLREINQRKGSIFKCYLPAII